MRETMRVTITREYDINGKATGYYYVALYDINEVDIWHSRIGGLVNCKAIAEAFKRQYTDYDMTINMVVKC